ncbi:DMT family transporter [Chloroflexota bacterium]
MLLGPFLALLGALFFSITNLPARRAVLRVKDTSAGVAVTIVISIPALFLPLIISGKVGDLLRFPWDGYLWLMGAGIVHYYIGRNLLFKSIRLVGVNRSIILLRSSPLVAVFLGVVVLREVVTGQMLMGILLLVAGVGLIGWNPWQSQQNKTSFASLGPKGILLGVGAGVCFGVSPLMIKIALNSFSSPIAALLIAFVGAAIAHVLLHAKGDKRKLLLTMNRRTFWLFSLSGLLVVFAQLFRFLAFSMAPISVITPIFSVSPLMLIILSFIFNRKLEVFNKSVIVAAVIVVTGALLLLWGKL